MPWGWYLAADYHLFLIIPAFVFALSYRRWWGYTALLVGYTVQAFITTITALMYSISAIPAPAKANGSLTGGTAQFDIDNWTQYFTNMRTITCL
jgi:hypothetical protein